MLSLWSDAGTGVEVIQLVGSETESVAAGRLDRLIQLFQEVATEEGWQPGDAIETARKRSIYFALEARGQTIGGLQLAMPDEQGTLPSFAIWPESRPLTHPANPKCAAHIGILALTLSVRGEGLLFWRVAVEMWRYCVGQGIMTLFIEVTPRVLPLYQRLGWPLKIEGELRSHWGEACYLCTLSIPEVAEALLRRSESSAYCRQIVAQAFRVTAAPVGKERGAVP